MALDYHDAVYPAVESADTLVEVDDEFVVKNSAEKIYDERPDSSRFQNRNHKESSLAIPNDPNVDDEVTNDCGLVYRYNLEVSKW